jgi:hypothetical protein
MSRAQTPGMGGGSAMSLLKRVVPIFPSALLLIMLGNRDGARAGSRPTVAEFMAKEGWTPVEIAAAVRGEVVTRTLQTRMVGPNNTVEVAVLGVVRVDVSAQTFLDAVEHPDTFRRASHLKTGVIQNPPQASDFAGVSLPAADIKQLKECRPGNCALRLTGPSLAELKSRIDWRSADVAEQVNRLARERLLTVLTDYMREGMVAFKPFEDSATPVNIDEQFRQLLDDTEMLITVCPELATYLRDYPHATLASSMEVFFWALEEFGLKPTLTVTQAVTYVPPGTEDVVVAWKQLYASHYFNGGLSTTTYAKEAEASYVVQLDCVRADGLGGAFGGVKRGKMASGMEGALKRYLQETKTKLQGAAEKTP